MEDETDSGERLIYGVLMAAREAESPPGRSLPILPKVVDSDAFTAHAKSVKTAIDREWQRSYKNDTG